MAFIGSFEATTVSASSWGSFAGAMSISGNVDLGNTSSDLIYFNAKAGGALDMNDKNLSNVNDVDLNGNITGDGASIISGITQLTASYAKITQLDVDIINSVTTTETTLEVVDKIITVASGSNKANTDGAGFRFGGNANSGSADILYEVTGEQLELKLAGTKYAYVNSSGLYGVGVVSGSGALQGASLAVDGAIAGGATSVSTLTGSGAANLTSLHCDSVNIDGGAIDGTNVTVGATKTLDVSAGTLTTAAAQNLAIVQGVGANTDIGAYDLRASTLTADSLPATRVTFAHTDGLLTGSSDMTFSSDTLTVTKLGAFEAAGAIDFGDQTMTNVDINSGAIDGVTIACSTLTGSGAANLTSLHCDSVNIDGGAIDGTPIGAASAAAGTFAAVVCTTLSGSGAANLTSLHCDSVNIDGGSIDATTIGASSQTTIKATTISGSGVLSLGSSLTGANGAYFSTYAGASGVGIAADAKGDHGLTVANYGTSFSGSGDITLGGGLTTAGTHTCGGITGSNGAYFSTYAGASGVGIATQPLSNTGLAVANYGTSFTGSGHLYVGGQSFVTSLTSSGNMMPVGDNTQYLGSASKRWKHIYATDFTTGDLHLNNERGSWSVIEEEDYLTLRNNKTGKRFKLVMEALSEDEYGPGNDGKM